MKPATRLRLSRLARPGAGLNPQCPGSSTYTTLSTSNSTTTLHNSPLLPFLYPRHTPTRSYSTTTSSTGGSSSSNSSADPWAFLLGTAESDTLPPPPPFLQHFGHPRDRSSQKDFTSSGYYPMLSHYQERIREKFSTHNIAHSGGVGGSGGPGGGGLGMGGGGMSPSSHSSSSRSGLDPTYSTITERERQIFASIFESILSESPIPGGTIGSPHSTLGGGVGSSSAVKDRLTRTPTPTLTALFESAVGPQFNRHELSFGPADPRKSSSITAAMARASAIAEYPASLRVAAAHAAGLPKVPLTKAEEREESLRQEQLVSTIRAMQNCQTDLELIEYLDKHVFTMVQPEHSSTTSSATAAPQGESINVKGKKYTFPSASYADLLAEGIKLLRKTFRDLSGALSVFERIKALGAESYIIGCSVTVYNHVLETMWEAYQDVFAIEALLEEMRINGVEGDANTVEILRILTRDAVRVGGGLGLPLPSPKVEGGGVALADHGRLGLGEKELECVFRIEKVADGMGGGIRAREESKWAVKPRGAPRERTRAITGVRPVEAGEKGGAMGVKVKVPSVL